jgi:hypothetical protein
MKRLLLLLSIFAFLIPATPESDNASLYVVRAEKVQPYETIWNLICRVESNNDSLAFCIDCNGLPSVGIAQIQESRLNDYNNRSGDSLTLDDMFHPAKAKKVFMWYCEGDYESISRKWNGGPEGMENKSTVKYYQKIISYISN